MFAAVRRDELISHDEFRKLHKVSMKKF